MVYRRRRFCLNHRCTQIDTDDVPEVTLLRLRYQMIFHSDGPDGSVRVKDRPYPCASGAALAGRASVLNETLCGRAACIVHYHGIDPAGQTG